MNRNLSVSKHRRAPSVALTRPGLGLLDRTGLYAAVGFTLLTAASFLGGVSWLLELLSHFRLQFVVAGTAIALWSLLRRRPKTTLIVAVATAANLMPLLPYFAPGAAVAEASQPQLRVMAANVSYHNQSYGQLREAIRRDDPDIVGFLEVNQVWVDEISGALPDHPYAVLRPQEGAYGLALFSRWPIEEMSASPYVEEGVQTAIAVELNVHLARITLVLAHLRAPTGPGKATLRNAQIAGIAAALASDRNDHQILIGDLNITPWSPQYDPLEAETGLVNAARGRGYIGTWPSWLPTRILRIPIDHCLLSDGLKVRQFRTGTDMGSDHLPIVADIAFAGPVSGEPL